MAIELVLLTSLLIWQGGRAVLDSSDPSEFKESLLCALKQISTVSDSDYVELYADKNTTEQSFGKCSTNHCYTFWTEDANGTTVLSQGCWETSGKPDTCHENKCISTQEPPKAANMTKFCCCSGYMCNANFTDAYIPVSKVSTTPIIITETSFDSNKLLIKSVSVTLMLLFVAILSVVTIFRYRRLPKKDDMENGQNIHTPPEDYNIEKLKLSSIIGQGRYGSVWKGSIDDQDVAIKVFPPHHRNYFLNEWDAYKMAGENPGLLKCFHGSERFLNGVTDYILIFSLERECLQEFLKNHVIHLPTLCKMSLGIAKGLAHLHSDIGNKLCIAHRDINTRNILVKADLSCCICDLGLAVIPKRTENRSLSEAGTLRYMAPEVLEGAVNLSDCESALKQIDVYSLGLVLWELGTRCADMQAAEPQPYTSPFYKDVGENPTLEQMQTLVSRRKARPMWPPSWKDTSAARLLCETAEDCWDQDADARLTSTCVEERLLELPTLRGRVLHPMHPPASPTPLINNNHLHDHSMESTVGTIETLLSPSEENCKNSNQLAICVTPLQPYQGRNPCLERNLLSGSSDCLLIDKSSKHCTSSESQNLITNDFLNFQLNHRTVVPIPYVQNAVHGSPKHYNGCPPNVVPASQNTFSKFNWSNFKKLFKSSNRNSNTLCSENLLRKETKVQITPAKLVNGFGSNHNSVGVTTTLINETKRPSTLPLKNDRFNEMKDNIKNNTSGVSQLLKLKDSLSRQRSLEQFNEVFSSNTDISKLKDPSARVKTPGDVPPSVRRTRGKAAIDSAARFSLYDDRIMGQWGSAPDLEPQLPKNEQQIKEQDRESISSF